MLEVHALVARMELPLAIQMTKRAQEVDFQQIRYLILIMTPNRGIQ